MRLKSLGINFLRLAGAAAGFGLFVLVFGAIVRPDIPAKPPSYDAKEVAAAEEARRVTLDRENPPRLQIDVDYSKGKSAPWYPKGESPVLAALVKDVKLPPYEDATALNKALAELAKEGKLPPVDQRVGPEPCVMLGIDGKIGKHGGTWMRVSTSPGDIHHMAYRMAYDTLVRFSPQGYPIVPHVAKSFSVSKDNKEFTFTLRKGVRWSDGHPFTADDIMYWWEHEANDKTVKANPPGIMSIRGEWGRVEKLGKYKVKFIFPHPNGLFISKMATYSGKMMLRSPKHFLRKYHPNPKIGDKEVIEKYMKSRNLPSPVAAYRDVKRGFNPEHPRMWPWVYRTYKANPPQTFVRNPYYYVVDPQGNQLPYVDRVLLEVKAPNLVAITASNGGITMQMRHLFFSDYELLMSQRKQGDYEVYLWYPGIRSSYLISPNMNLRIDPDKPETRLKHELLNDKRFRQAMSLAINRQVIIDAEYNGVGEAAQAGPGPGAYFYHKGFYESYVKYDPERANRLLDEIGLTRRDRKGYRTFKDGSRMTFFLNYCEWTGGGPGPGQFIVDDWAEVGVRVILRERSTSLYGVEKQALVHDFDVWDGGPYLPTVTPYLFVGGEYALGCMRWFNLGGLYGNPRADAARGCIEPPKNSPLRRSMELVEAVTAESDKARQREIYNEIFDIAAENVWTINISTGPPFVVVVKNGFKNVPRMAVSAFIFLTPGSAGVETFYFENPHDSPVAIRQIKHDIANVTPPPDAPASEEAEAAGSIIGRIIRYTFLIIGICLVVMLAVRHPYIGRRLLIMIPTLLIISIIVFTIIQLPPGDYVTTRIIQLKRSGDEVDLQQMEEIREYFHLEEPVVKRYARWMGLMWFQTVRMEKSWPFFSGDARDKGLLQGNMGRSMASLKSVNDIIGDRVLLTFLISLGTILFTWAIAVPIGIYSAVKQYSIGDYIFTFIGFIGMCIPGFLLAILLIYASGELFNIREFGLFSSQYGAQPEWTFGKVIDLLKHIWIPILVMGVGGTGGMIRVMRGNLLDELKKPYVVTARAKGVRPMKLLMKYPVRLALNPFISSIGGIFPTLISGGAIVAMVLSLTTVGPLMLDALRNEDMFLAGSMLMVLSLLGVVGTLVSDLLLLWLDPRIRFKGGSR